MNNGLIRPGLTNKSITKVTIFDNLKDKTYQYWSLHINKGIKSSIISQKLKLEIVLIELIRKN